MYKSIGKSETQIFTTHGCSPCTYVWRFFRWFVHWFGHLLCLCVPRRCQSSGTYCVPSSDDTVQILQSSSFNSLKRISFSNSSLPSASMACCSKSDPSLKNQKRRNHEVNKLLRRYSQEAEREVYLLLLGKYCYPEKEIYSKSWSIFIFIFIPFIPNSHVRLILQTWDILRSLTSQKHNTYLNSIPSKLYYNIILN